jgi:long-chain acyl-CoA synthetase
VRHQLKDSGAKALIVLDAVYEKQVAGIIDQTEVEHIIGASIVDLCGFSPVRRFLGKLLKKIPTGPMPSSARQFMKLVSNTRKPPEVMIDPRQDIAVLQYTGGTTGIPKGAMLSARNLVANLDQCLAWVGRQQPETGWLGVLPLFHVFAMTCCMNLAVATGGFMLLFPSPPADMKKLALSIQRWGKGCSLIMAGVAALFNKINQTDGLEEYDLSSLKKCLSGAGPLPSQVQLDFEKKTGAKVVEGYGLSETSPVVTANPFDLEPGVKRVPGSIGLPISSTECRVVDLEDPAKVLPLGKEHIGELCIRGPQVMQGYWNNPEETTQVLAGGWLRTGDIACMDERGWIYIKDRARDLVKHKGYSVFPQEVEDYIYRHPAVLETAVVGLPKPDGDEELKAYIVLKPDYESAPDGDQIISWCRDNMAKYKVPDTIEFRDELPKTMVGKVLRRVLRDAELAKKPRQKA